MTPILLQMSQIIIFFDGCQVIIWYKLKIIWAQQSMNTCSDTMYLFLHVSLPDDETDEKKNVESSC